MTDQPDPPGNHAETESKKETNHLIDSLNQAEHADQIEKNVDEDSLNEQSFEVVPSASFLSTKMDDCIRAEADRKSKPPDEISGQPIHNSNLFNNSPKQRNKTSINFLTRLQSSSDEKDGSNISSSIVSAISSLSSFTSNFSLGSTVDATNTSSNLTIETLSSPTSKSNHISESREDVFSKKAAMERKNLISLTKLIVKDLISSSLRTSRTIDDYQNVVHLDNYFTLIDRVLKHGLKQNLLSSKSINLWNALDSLPKYLKESTLMSESVRSLAHTKTPDGKIKAWMRLAMMQKKLPEYFNELLTHKNVLLMDIYQEYAFILNDEAHVFAGLIIGVNVIDCNFFVKDANFDIMDDIINLEPYLRSANSYDTDDDVQSDEVHVNDHNLKRILDQKNYLEERNKRLDLMISELQARTKRLEEQNSKLEMEAKVSEARISKLQGKSYEASSTEKLTNVTSGSLISDAIKNFINTHEITNSEQQSVDDSTVHETDSAGSAMHISCSEIQLEEASELKSHLNEVRSENRRLVKELEVSTHKINELDKGLTSVKERASILESSYRASLEKIKLLERDLDIQTSMNADKETTIKVYEKDIREKQAQVESLRNSLNESKKMYTGISERLEETNNKLKERFKSINSLQTSLDKWKLENKTLAARLQEKQTELKTTKDELENTIKLAEELKNYNQHINDELKRARESDQTSSDTVESQNGFINELKGRLQKLESELKNFKPYREQAEELASRCKEYEQSLEEIGSQLRESRLEAESLKEDSAVFLDSQWMDSKQVKCCTLCQLMFSVTRRKHHCRLCGNVFCQICSDNKMELASSAKPVRVCDTCHGFLLAKFVKSSI